jgi:predicted transcriptional regulator
MEVHFTPEQESRISEFASHHGTNAEQLVKEATMRLLDEDERFRAAVREGVAAADRGEFVEHEEVWANIEAILRS